MTIDEVIQSLTAMKSVIGVNQFTINEAIETMRKYQKIEQIYHLWNEVNDFSYNQAMREIGEVVEDATN